jgi:hypothetical protein
MDELPPLVLDRIFDKAARVGGPLQALVLARVSPQLRAHVDDWLTRRPRRVCDIMECAAQSQHPAAEAALLHYIDTYHLADHDVLLTAVRSGHATAVQALLAQPALGPLFIHQEQDR